MLASVTRFGDEVWLTAAIADNAIDIAEVIRPFLCGYGLVCALSY